MIRIYRKISYLIRILIFEKNISNLNFSRLTFNFLKRLILNKLLFRVFIKKYSNKEIYHNLNNLINQSTSTELVSVIIPVNNGISKGKLKDVINSLKKQTWENIEIIAIDSGSTDETINYLKSENINVVEIPSAKFSHSYSRNYGAEKAKGKYLLFTVDDAIFKDINWIKKSIYLINHLKVDAISTNQIVDGNEDDYARLLNFYQNHSQSKNHPILIKTKNSFLLRQLFKIKTLRTIEGAYNLIMIDDTNHLVKKNIFDKIKFCGDTVEDLTFGVNLILKGYNIGFTSIYSCVHYHNYPLNIYSLENYFKRIYLDTLAIQEQNFQFFEIKNKDSFVLEVLKILVKILDFYEKKEENLFQSRFKLYFILKNHKLKNIDELVYNFSKKIFRIDFKKINYNSFYHNKEIANQLLAVYDSFFNSRSRNISLNSVSIRQILIYLTLNFIAVNLAKSDFFNEKKLFKISDWS